MGAKDFFPLSWPSQKKREKGKGDCSYHSRKGRGRRIDRKKGNGGARDGGRGGVGTGLDDVDFADAAPDLDNCRGSVEVLQTFTGSSSYFHGYLFV